MSAQPLVTVIIPTYNYAHYISAAIDSVLASSFPQQEIEIVIVDDGSTDHTSDIVQAYQDRVTYFYQANRGKAHATQAALDLAHGKYIFNLDADDLFLPQKIENVVEVFESDGEISHVGHSFITHDVSRNVHITEKVLPAVANRKIAGEELLIYLYQRNSLYGGGSAFAARADVLKARPIPLQVDMYIDEYMVLSVLGKGHCSYLIDEPLFIWTLHGKNFSATKYDVLEKSRRSVASMQAVYQELAMLDFGNTLHELYKLKILIMELRIQEAARSKRFSNVVELWQQVFNICSLIKVDFFELMRCYKLINRTMPTSVLNLARSLKYG